MATKRWTTEEEKILADNYAEADLNKLSKRLGRSYNAILQRARQNGLKRNVRKVWTLEKIEYLKNNYHSMSSAEIAKKLNVNKQSVWSKAAELKLGPRDREEEYTEEEDKQLLKLKTKGLTWKQIGKKLNRTWSSASNRYVKITTNDKSLTEDLDYDKIEEYKKLKISGTKWNDIDCSNDIYFNYKDLGEAIIINAGRDLIESIKSLERVVDCNIPDKVLKETVEEVLKDESAFFTPIYSLCTKIPGEVMVRKCWNEVGVDRNKYLRKNLHLIS